MREILFQLTYIKVVLLEDGFYSLVIEDKELNDFVEDFIVEECDIELWAVKTENNGDRTYHYHYFQNNILPENLISSLKKLDIIELERIFGLNNN